MVVGNECKQGRPRWGDGIRSSFQIPEKILGDFIEALGYVRFQESELTIQISRVGVVENVGEVLGTSALETSLCCCPCHCFDARR